MSTAAIGAEARSLIMLTSILDRPARIYGQAAAPRTQATAPVALRGTRQQRAAGSTLRQASHGQLVQPGAETNGTQRPPAHSSFGKHSLPQDSQLTGSVANWTHCVPVPTHTGHGAVEAGQAFVHRPPLQNSSGATH
jgi:hypothetical protein